MSYITVLEKILIAVLLESLVTVAVIDLIPHCIVKAPREVFCILTEVPFRENEEGYLVDAISGRVLYDAVTGRPLIA